MKQRMHDIGGACQIESVPARGTCVRFAVPIGAVATATTPQPATLSPKQTTDEYSEN